MQLGSETNPVAKYPLMVFTLRAEIKLLTLAELEITPQCLWLPNAALKGVLRSKHL